MSEMPAKKKILITQRVEVLAERQERRDALDQRWIDLVCLAGFEPVVVPNNETWVKNHLATKDLPGLLLTGGNSLRSAGGDAPERDLVEQLLFQKALAQGTPVLGVCRGMQVVLDHFGAVMQPVEGHVAQAQKIQIEGRDVVVNSFHDWGHTEVPGCFQIWAKADDGVIKAVKHNHMPVWGIMWHPERIQPFRSEDISILQSLFNGQNHFDSQNLVDPEASS